MARMGRQTSKAPSSLGEAPGSSNRATTNDVSLSEKSRGGGELELPNNNKSAVDASL